MNLRKRKPVEGPGGHRSTLVIYVDCDDEDFAWVQNNCVKAVEDYLDEAFSQMVFPRETSSSPGSGQQARVRQTGRADARPELPLAGRLPARQDRADRSGH